MLSKTRPIRVRMEDISKRYGAVMSLDRREPGGASAGEVLGLVGDNGAGKSTLMKVLSGAVIPDAGRIFIDGREVRFASPADARRERIEMVYQDLSLCDTIDVSRQPHARPRAEAPHPRRALPRQEGDARRVGGDARPARHSHPRHRASRSRTFPAVSARASPSAAPPRSIRSSSSWTSRRRRSRWPRSTRSSSSSGR